MKFALLVLICFSSTWGHTKDNPFESEMLQGVYKLQIQKSEDSDTITKGTGFLTEQDGNLMLVTVKHLILDAIGPQKLDSESCVTMHATLQNNKGIVTMTLRFYCSPNFDIAIAKLDPFCTLSAMHKKYHVEKLNLNLGTYSIFVGFPTLTFKGKGFDICRRDKDGECLPLVKIGRLSGSDLISGDLYIDAMNTIGFSGSPVFAMDDNSKKFKLAGMVTGLLFQQVSKPGNEKFEWTEDYYSNSGVTKAVNLDAILNTVHAAQKIK